MNEDLKKIIIKDLNIKIGGDINDLSHSYELEHDLIVRRNELQSSLNVANNEVPTKLSASLEKAEQTSKQIDSFKSKSLEHQTKVDEFLQKTEPLRLELEKRFYAINKLENVLLYLKSYEKIEELSQQMKQCNDDEQLVLWYGELKDMCAAYKIGHRAAYVQEYTHYWHNILKDRLSKHFEDVMKLLKWPFSSGVQNSPPPKEILVKFNNMTRYLFLIEEPESVTTNDVSNDLGQDRDPCLPVRLLLRPLKKRFAYHFTGPRLTARISRPEWFLTQTLTWIKDHQSFITHNVQPIADKLELKNRCIVDEFNAGITAFAAERLHTVLGLYQNQGSKSERLDVDAAFAHAVDETLGFHREFTLLTGKETNSVLAVLTKAEMFVRWLAVEKKYALAKMDETLGSEQWSEPVAAGLGAVVGSMVWVPRGADWFIALLKTIEDRYRVLPQPGHRLQFLELQLELVEEWRVRLTQLLNAAAGTLTPETFLVADASPHPLTAAINAVHHTRATLLQWAHSLHYLQLHYFRSQFQQYTQQQHHDDESSIASHTSAEETENEEEIAKKEEENDASLSLKEVEVRAKKLALIDVSRQNSMSMQEESNGGDITSPIANLGVTETLSADADAEEAGVFAEAPALLAHLRDAGLAALAEHILLEFKAGLREYKKQKWHAWQMVEEMALCVSAPLCRPLSGLCARLSCAAKKLAPALTTRLRAHLANDVDQYIFEEIVLENWFNTGGMTQFSYDVKRNLAPVFAPPNKIAAQVNQLPKLLESCKLLNMDYDDARNLQMLLDKRIATGADVLVKKGIRHIHPNEALKILNQRTDLQEVTAPSSVMDLF